MLDSIRTKTTPAFHTLAEAQNTLRLNLTAVLRNAYYNPAEFNPAHEVRWYQLLEGEGIRGCPKGRYRVFKPHIDLVTVPQLTPELAAAEPDLPGLYTEKMAPLIIRIWQEAYEKTLADPRVSRIGLIPYGLFGNTFQGQLNWDIAFTYVATKPEYMGWQFDEATRTIDPRLRPENHEAFWRKELGLKRGAALPKRPWVQIMAKYLLGGGFKNFYGGSMLEVLLSNYPWIFTYEGEHAHRLDFVRVVNRWDDISHGSTAWVEADHIISEHLGIKVYDPETKQIDPRLFPQQHKALLREFGLPTFTELLVGARLGGLLERKGIDGHPGRLLSALYPEAFRPEKGRAEHLREHWFRHRRYRDDEVREAFWYEVKLQNIPETDIPRACTQDWFDRNHLSVLVSWRSRLIFFKRYFPEKFEQGIWSESDFA